VVSADSFQAPVDTPVQPYPSLAFLVLRSRTTEGETVKHEGNLWIVIPRWDGEDGFQHYKDREPIWIKNYTRLLSSDSYLGLTFVQRGVLHGLWLEYARSNRQIRDSTLSVSRRLGERVTSATLDALNHAGFVAFSASKPLAPCKQLASPEEETERDEEKDQEQTTHQSTSTSDHNLNGRASEEDLPAELRTP